MSQLVIDWVKQNSTINTISGNGSPSCAMDNAGNIYVTYASSSSASGVSRTGSTTDIIVLKMNSSGSVEWIRQNAAFNTSLTDQSPTITLDQYGNIYVAYNTSSGTASGQTNTGTNDIVIFKLSPTGDIMWIRQNNLFNTASIEGVDHKIISDMSNNIYVVYTTTGTTSGNIRVGASNNIAICKMDYSGNVVWVRQNNTFNSSSSISPSCTFDASGNICVVYNAQGSIVSGQVIPSGDSSTCVVFKMSPEGNLLFLRQSGLFMTAASILLPSIASDSKGNLYITTQFTGSSSGNSSSGNTDLAVLKLNSEGNVVWIRQNSIMNTPLVESNSKIISDASGNLLIAYQTTGTVSGQVSLGATDIVFLRMDTNGNIIDIQQPTALNTPYLQTSINIVSNSNRDIALVYNTASPVSGQTHTAMSDDIVIAKMTSQGDIAWVLQNDKLNTISQDADGSIVFDSSGFLYVAYAVGNVISGQNLSIGNVGAADVVIAKISPTGSIVWVNQSTGINTSGTDNSPKIAIDSSNNIYVTYTTYGTTSGGTKLGTATQYDIAVTKFNSSGVVQWVRQNPVINTLLMDLAPVITVDSQDNIYIAYQTDGVSSGNTKLTNQDIVLLKMNSSGNVLWIKQNSISTNGSDAVPSIVTDSYNNLYLAYRPNSGAASGQTFFGGSDDIVLLKMNSSGNILWIKQDLSTSGADSWPVLSIDSSGNICIAYTTSGTVSGGNRLVGLTNDIVVAKINPDGNVVWIQQNPAVNTVSNDNYPKISTDSSGNIYVGYTTSGAVSGQTNTGSDDNVVFKMDSAGNVVWVRQNSTFNTKNKETLNGFKVSPSGDLYMSFITNILMTQITAHPNDVVVAKMRQVQTFPPTITSNMSLGAYLASAATSITSANKQEIKDYILQNRASFASPIADVSGSIVAQLIDSQAPGYNVGSVGSVVTVLPQANGQTTATAVNITSQIPSLVSGAKGLYFFGGKGYVHTVQINSTNYSFTVTDTGLKFNGIDYGMNDAVPFGAYRFTIKYLGSVGGILTQVAPVPEGEIGTNTAYPSAYTAYVASTDVSGSRAAIVSPFAGNYSGSTTATIGVTDITSQQYFTNIDAVFEKELTEAQAIQLLNSFQIVDTNTDLGYPLIAGSISGDQYAVPATQQDTPNFNVELVDLSGFIQVLVPAMSSANQTTGKNLPNVENYFEEEMRVELNTQLRDIGLLEMLIGSNLTDVQVSLDISGGAGDIATRISEPDVSGQTQLSDKRRQFLTQIPLETLNSYIAEAQKEVHYLPLKGGDSMTFVFDITVAAPSVLTTQVKNQYDNTPNSFYGTTINGVNMTAESRRVAFVLHLTNKDATFRRDFAAVSATGAPVITNIADAKKYVKEKTLYLTSYGPTYVSALQAATVASPFTSAEWIAQAKYELALAEQTAYASSGVYLSSISSISSA